MPPHYDKWVATEGNHAHRLLRDELRIKLAHDALGRVLRANGTIRVADVQKACYTDLLGELWMLYGWKQRRKLARARDMDMAFLEVVLEGAGLDATVVDGKMRVDSGRVRDGLDRLDSAAKIRAGLAKKRRQDALGRAA
jgi:hypothetical protein